MRVLLLLIMDFDTLEYLSTGNARQRDAYAVLTKSGIFEALHGFTPVLTGTVPIGIDNAQSDLDIICCCVDQQLFADHLTRCFGYHDGFTLWRALYHGRDTVVANFNVNGFALEIFGQNRPVKQQEAYRHMVVEYVLLMEHGEPLRREVIRLKNSGIKTEPAFAKALGLQGDPYEALLKLGDTSI
jgi:Domain of unknown function (DUF4269)